MRLREKQWFNVGWGEETTASGTHRLVHHPRQVWFRSTFSRQEPWTKVDLVIKEEDRRYPPALYDGPIPLKPEKVKDLKIAEKHLPAPQRFFYLDLVENEGPEEEVLYIFLFLLLSYILWVSWRNYLRAFLLILHSLGFLEKLFASISYLRMVYYSK